MNNTKARSWTAILYPESLTTSPEEWSDIIARPYAHILHDKDTDKDGKPKKPHIHIIIEWPSPTTYKNALSTFQALGTVSKCEPVKNDAHAWKYLIHDTEGAKKANKHLYSPEERKTGNGYEPHENEATTAQKEAILEDLASAIINEQITNFADLYILACTRHGKEGARIARANSGFLERLTRGMFNKTQTQQQRNTTWKGF